MRLVIQRVSEASVKVNDILISGISRGLLILVGIETDDNKDDADWLAAKVANLRIFPDDNDIMNRSVQEIKGELLAVSQFTLMASTKKGNRPSYIRAAHPSVAMPLYEYFCNSLSNQTGIMVKKGIFGADMKVGLINDGPVTIIMDSKRKE
ncbi:MAG: D-tyrosyl-tRNA(Tyr) deacylase [Muribaculaceae bacterium]|nr:D-tyrosyl-tRNA(Tyr) deacylase [Muribaculaceae bacterium]